MHFTLKLSAVAVLLALSGCQSSDDSTPGDVNLRLMETSDVHSNLLSFDPRFRSQFRNKLLHTEHQEA